MIKIIDHFYPVSICLFERQSFWRMILPTLLASLVCGLTLKPESVEVTTEPSISRLAYEAGDAFNMIVSTGHTGGTMGNETCHVNEVMDVRICVATPTNGHTRRTVMMNFTIPEEPRAGDSTQFASLQREYIRNISAAVDNVMAAFRN